MCAPARSRPARSPGGTAPLSTITGATGRRWRRSSAASTAAPEEARTATTTSGGGPSADAGRRVSTVMALGGERAHERLVPALGDDEDAPAGLGSGLHGRESTA